MNPIPRLKHLIALLGATLLAACIGEETLPARDTPADEPLTIRICVPATTQPRSRALAAGDEYAIDQIAVLAFDAVQKTYRGRYAGRVVGAPTPVAGSKSAATMRFEVALPIGDFDLMVVANADALLDAASLAKGASQSQIEKAVTMTMSAQGWEDDASKPAHFIPMWGYAKGVALPEAGGDGVLDKQIYLTRMVAKVDVALTQTLVDADKFDLKSVRVYNYGEQGRLIPYTDGAFDWTGVTSAAKLAENQTPSLPEGFTQATPASEFIDYPVTDESSLLGSIYLFEAGKGVSPLVDPVKYLQNPCLVIGGSYRGGATSYYRIDFAKNTGTSTAPGWLYLPILRNNSYTVSITDVSGPGFPDQEEALNSAPSNIDANVVDWNNEEITTIITNGIYSLGVSQNLFRFDRTAYGATSASNILSVVTDYPGGWKSEVFDTEAGTGTAARGWLSLSASSESTPNAPNGTPVRLLLKANTSGVDRTAYIHFSAGNIRLVVKVVQLNRIDVSLTIVDMNDQPIDLLEFAPDGTPAQQFKVKWTPEERPVTISKRQVGSEDFLWQDACNLLTTIPGGVGEYTFTIDPTAFAANATFGNRAMEITFSVSDEQQLDVAEGTIELYQGQRFESVTPTLQASRAAVAPPVAGQQTTIDITSYASATLAGGQQTEGPVSWRAEYSLDGITWTDEAPEWLTFQEGVFTTSDHLHTRPMTITPLPERKLNLPDSLLQKAAPRGTQANPYDLSMATGKRNTANSYIVDAPGWYKIPLVYGNAVKDGAANPGAYTTQAPATDKQVLHAFPNHAGDTITTPYIVDHLSDEEKAKMSAHVVWQDYYLLIDNSDVSISADGQSIVFYIAPQHIKQANACIGFWVGGAGGYAWTWHIWVTSLVDPLAPTRLPMINLSGNTYGLMEYNLGWLQPEQTYYGQGAGYDEDRVVQVRVRQVGIPNPRSVTIAVVQPASLVAPKGASLFYQWGRSVPFPCYELPIFDATGSLTTRPVGTLAEGIAYAKNFILSDYWQNWFSESAPGGGTSNGKAYYTNMWSADNTDLSYSHHEVVKTIYDPTPYGWKMPPVAAFSGMVKGSQYANAPDDQTRDEVLARGGIDLYLDPNDPSKGSSFFPLEGARQAGTGALSLMEEYGYYWTASPQDNYGVPDGRARSFQVAAYSDPPRADSRYSTLGRASGAPVRPIAE